MIKPRAVVQLVTAADDLLRTLHSACKVSILINVLTPWLVFCGVFVSL